jgi:hypothetical protein
MGERTSREIATELIAALDRESVTVPDHDLKIAAATALKTLRRATVQFNLPSERREARSHYRLVCAALGYDHE